MILFRRLVLFSLVLTASLAARAQSTVPALTQALPAQTLSTAGGSVNVDLRNYFNLPGVTGQVAQFDTVLGKFNVELFASDTPLSVANFLSYVNDGSYNNTFIHRSTALGATATSNRIVQGGGYAPPNGASITRKSAIALEYKLANTRGTLAMARSSALNSATSEWFFNVDDNTTVLGASNNGGYAVFARVLGSGMAVVDAIAAVPTYNIDNGVFSTLPLRNIATGQNQINPENFITINSITAVPVYPTNNTSPAVLTFTPANNNSSVVAVTISGSTLTLTPVGAGTATISIRAADTNSNFASGTLSVTVAAANSAPVITTQPVSQNVATGSTAVFNVVASGVPTPIYQWSRNGVALPGATGSRLVLTGTAQAGNYAVVVTNSVGSVTSSNATLAFTTTSDVGRLTNLSVLADLTADDPSFTVGTVIGGGTAGVTKPLLVREAGPSLTQLGVTGVLVDPIFSLADGSSKVIGGNDDWGSDSTLSATFVRLGAFAFSSPTSKDAALYQAALAPGNYTVIVGSHDRSAGKVIAEIYDATPAGSSGPGTPRLLDISVLKQIASGGSMTAGFVIGGSTSRTVLVRAIGPGLAALGVPAASTLVDPFVELFDGGSRKIFENDNWGGDPQIAAANTSVGAFAIASLSSKDAIMLVTLAPGNYTARVTGVGGAAGLVVVEVYDVP